MARSYLNFEKLVAIPSSRQPIVSHPILGFGPFLLSSPQVNGRSGRSPALPCPVSTCLLPWRFRRWKRTLLLAALGRGVMREACQHDWCDRLKYECGIDNADTAAGMISGAKDQPHLVEARWQWLLAANGLRFDPWDHQERRADSPEWTVLRQRWKAEQPKELLRELTIQKESIRYIEPKIVSGNATMGHFHTLSTGLIRFFWPPQAHPLGESLLRSKATTAPRSMDPPADWGHAPGCHEAPTIGDGLLPFFLLSGDRARLSPLELWPLQGSAWFRTPDPGRCPGTPAKNRTPP